MEFVEVKFRCKVMKAAAWGCVEIAMQLTSLCIISLGNMNFD